MEVLPKQFLYMKGLPKLLHTTILANLLYKQKSGKGGGPGGLVESLEPYMFLRMSQVILMTSVTLTQSHMTAHPH
jgi:hypothetical protein